MINSTIGLGALCIWLYLAFGRGSFWRVPDGAKGLRASARRPWPEVRVVVPARNEQETVAGTILSLIRQDFPGRLDIIVVDDQSTDGTGDEVRRVSERRIGAEGGDERRSVRVIEGRPPPPGWTGKLWAMSQGLDAPGGAPDYVWFVDADIVVDEGCLQRLVATAEAEGLVLASLMVKLRCESAAERWLVPAFVFFFQMIYPFAWVNDPHRDTAAAAGGCMLVRRGSLAEAGSLPAVKGALIDDCAIGRAMKRVGPIRLDLATAALSVRPYPDVRSFGRMVSRSAFAQLDYSVATLAFVVAAMIVVFCAPPLLALFAEGWPRLFGVLAWGLMAALFAPTLRYYGRPAWSGLALPAIAAAYLVFTLQSAFAHSQGRGGEWKGRHQALPRARGT
jgi:hopene-associated glycosyltransferase HpnB